MRAHTLRRAGAAGAAGALAIAACGCAALRPAIAPVPQSSLQAHVNFLASDALEGRMTGTQSYRVAAEYVQSQFRQAGLSPMGTDGYLQPVPYASSLIDPQSSSVRIHRGGKSRTLKWKDEFVASGDPLRERTRVRAGAVFVGYGVEAKDQNYNDYADVDVRGKIVVLMSGAPKSFAANPRAYHSSGWVKEQTAVARGAVGLVTLRSAYGIAHYPWAALVQNAGAIPSMNWLSADGKASHYHPELRGAVGLSESIAAALFEGAAKTHAQLLEADQAGQPLSSFPLPLEIEISRRNALDRVTSPNVVGLLPGSDPKLAGEYVVYTAHLDHIGTGNPVNGDRIYNGAYDNAMGVAALIETARLLALAKPRRSVLFVTVGGEERGLLGSDYFAQHPTVPAAGIVANINLDMPLFLYPLADVVAFGAEHSTLGPVVATAAEAEGLKLAPDPLPDEVIFIRSDQYSFVRQGVPSIFLVSGFASRDPAIDGGAETRKFLQTHYHKPSDDLSRPVDWPSAQKFTRVNARIGLAVANSDRAPRWNAGNFFGELFGKPALPP
jgi:hypothetical protein